MINPEDIKKAKEINQKVLEQLLSDDGIFGAIKDLNLDQTNFTVGGPEGFDNFNDALEEAANNGNSLAKAFLDNRAALSKTLALQAATQKAQLAEIANDKQGKKAAGILAGAEFQGLDFDAEGDVFARQLQKILDNIDDPQVRAAVAEAAGTIRQRSIDEGKAATEAQKTARLLQRS